MSRATLTQNESVIERAELEPGTPAASGDIRLPKPIRPRAAARSLATLEAWGG